MFLGIRSIDDYLTFTVTTQNVSTGNAADADAVPSYRVYEDETATAILTGDMAKLDDDNTIGLYSERIQLTAASGFEDAKTYSVYIAATVAGVSGTTTRTFQVGPVASNMTKLGGSAQSATDLKDFSDTGYDPSTHKVAGVVLSDALTTNNDKTGYGLADGAITAAKISDSSITTDKFTDSALQGVWSQIKGTPTAGSYGEFVGTLSTATNLAAAKTVIDAINTIVASGVHGNAALKTLVDAIDVIVDAIKLKTDLIPASPAAVGSAMTLADDAITAAKFDETTAFPLKSADAGATAVARTGADGDTLETISDQLDGPVPANVTQVLGEAVTESDPVTTIDAILAILESATYGNAALQGLIDALKAVADAVKLKTDTIPASPASVSDIPTTAQIKTAIEAAGSSLAQILEDTATTIPASISSLNNLSDAEVVAALKASTGWTAGNTMTLAVLIKVIAAFIAGNWQDGTSGYDVKDIDDGTTTILNIVPSTTTPQKTVVIS